MPDCINTVTVKVLVQDNDIIRMADSGLLIGRLVDSVTFQDVAPAESTQDEQR